MGVTYTISRNGQTALERSRLGLVREDDDFSKALFLVSLSPVTVVNDNYVLETIKRKVNHYQANKETIHLKNAHGELMDIIFQISNDGALSGISFPWSSVQPKKSSKN